MDLMLKRILEAKAAQEPLVKASGLDWVIVRPGGLTDGPRTGAYRRGVDPTLKSDRIARADVANFVLRQLTDETFLRQTPAVTGPRRRRARRIEPDLASADRHLFERLGQALVKQRPVQGFLNGGRSLPPDDTAYPQRHSRNLWTIAPPVGTR